MFSPFTLKKIKNKIKLWLIYSYFSPDSGETTFSKEKAILWIEELFAIKNVLMRDFFYVCLSQTLCFLLQKTLIDGLELYYGL